MNISRAAARLENLETFSRRDSPVHRLHPAAQITAAFVYIAAVVSFPRDNLSGLGVYALYPTVLVSLSGTPLKPLLLRFLLSLPFVLAGAAANLVFLRNTVFYLGPLAVTAGMVSFASILFRAFLAVTAALLLSALVPFPLLVRQITRMGLPKVFGLQLFLTWRYLSVLLAEAGTMYTAYLLRSKNAKGVKMKDMGSFLGNLLIRSFDRAGRIYTAMKCRGFDGTFSVSLGHSKKPMRPADWFYAAGVSLAALFFRFFDAGRAMGRLAGRFL